jgi:hypothetical protein
MCIDVMIDNESDEDRNGKTMYLEDIPEKKIRAFVASCPDSLRATMVQDEKNGIGVAYIPRDSLPDEIFLELGEFFGDSVKAIPIPAP